MANDDTSVPTLIKELTTPSSRKAKKQQIEADLQPTDAIMDDLTFSNTENKIKKGELSETEEELVDEVE